MYDEIGPLKTFLSSKRNLLIAALVAAFVVALVLLGWV